jgi:hypothetical protein
VAAIFSVPVETTTPGLGEWEDKDFSDPAVREGVYATLISCVEKPEETKAVFSSCCGSVVFGEGGKRTYPFVKTPSSLNGDPTAPLLGTLFNDGTFESILACARARYTPEWLAFHANYTGSYNLFNPLYRGKEAAERELQAWARGYTTDKVRLIFSWGLTAEEAINKWFVEEDYRKTAKSLDFDDQHDGKACLIWTDQ